MSIAKRLHEMSPAERRRFFQADRPAAETPAAPWPTGDSFRLGRAECGIFLSPELAEAVDWYRDGEQVEEDDE